MQLQSNSPAAGMQLPGRTAVAPSDAQLAAASPKLSGGTTAAATSAQLPHTNSAANADLPSASSAALSVPDDSADQDSTNIADSRVTAEASSTTAEDAPRPVAAVQPGTHLDSGSHDLQMGGQHAVEPLRGLADPNKRLLAKMGSQAPSDVSKQLLQEIGARSQMEGLLQVCLRLCCSI